MGHLLRDEMTVGIFKQWTIKKLKGGDTMFIKLTMIMVGLGLYSLSLVFKGNQWFFALPGGILLFLGCLAFLSWVKNLVKRQNISDSDMEKATQRVLQVLKKEGPGRYIEISP